MEGRETVKMNSTERIGKLRGYGADIAGIAERFMDDYAFYGICLEQFVRDVNFDALGQALENRDFQAAFEAAHSLKGVAANLGLTPIYAAINKVVIALRMESYEGARTGYREIIARLDEIRALV